ncbi:hypothetical protein FS842_008305 [Serendipita sp. 407]|nr:hypothetical protein FS842_008305 [Serendipita sp. 407]
MWFVVNIQMGRRVWYQLHSLHANWPSSPSFKLMPPRILTYSLLNVESESYAPPSSSSLPFRRSQSSSSSSSFYDSDQRQQKQQQ